MNKDGRIARQHQSKRDAQAAPASKKRMYAGAKAGRLDFVASTSSADGELYSSLRSLRNKSRMLTRDNAFAKRAKQIVINNVIGQGVGMQAQVKSMRNGSLIKRTNDGIERAWRRWSRAEYCHTGGVLDFADLERMAFGELFEAGEVFIRLHRDTFGGSNVPLGLELIEAERIADDHEVTPLPGNQVTLGIEHDQYHRPVAYFIHEPSITSTRGVPSYQRGNILRIPADQIRHVKLVDRWPQMRGAPMLHASISRLHQLGEYENAALVAARIGASKVGFFEPQEWIEQDLTDEDINGQPSTTVVAGEFTQLPPGYKFNSWDPTYPHQLYADFTRAALRGIAAGVGMSFESLSRDYSQSNYSSSRLALLDDRDVWRVLQAWFIRSFREPLHREWMNAAVLARAIPEVALDAYVADPDRFEAVRMKPRGWSWIDPQKEVAAYREAEKAGYITKREVINQTGNGADIEDYIDNRADELAMLDAAGIVTDTTEFEDPNETLTETPPPDAQADDEVDDDDQQRSPLKLYEGNR